jgi:hypothetical protein
MPERIRAAVVTLAVVGLVAGGAVAGAQTTPTVEPDDATVAGGETTTVAVTLSAAPDGLAGFNLTVEATGGTARFVGASAADYGITTGRAEDGRATLEGVDIDENVQAGATDVRLGTVTVRGESAGETDLSVSVRRMDDDDGEPVSPETEPAALTVTGDSGDAENGSAGGSDASTATAGAGSGDDGGPTPTGTAGTTESAGTRDSSSDGGAAAGAQGITGVPSNVVAVALVALLAAVSFVAGLAANRFR